MSMKSCPKCKEAFERETDVCYYCGFSESGEETVYSTPAASKSRAPTLPAREECSFAASRAGPQEAENRAPARAKDAVPGINLGDRRTQLRGGRTGSSQGTYSA